MTAPLNSLNALATLEEQVLVAATSLQAAEQAMPEAVQENNVSITPDLDAKTVAITVVLPIGFAVNAGKLEITALDYTAVA